MEDILRDIYLSDVVTGVHQRQGLLTQRFLKELNSLGGGVVARPNLV